MAWTTIHTKGQWAIQINESGEYRVINPGADGTLQFYQAISGKYGEPILQPEPDLAVNLPSGRLYVRKDGSPIELLEKISGIIVKGTGGETILRVSLTNAKNKSIQWSLDDKGILTIDGKEHVLYALVSKDKNRVRNYDAFFRADESTSQPVRYLELEDLV